jgi:tetraacyldisaccharide 4'-kinase
LVSGEHYRALVNGQRGIAPAICRLGLRAASVPYGGVVWLRNRLYDHGYARVYRAPASVVSVGNLTLGGTGKTPCVEYLARHFVQQGRQVAILSRGYGGTNERASMGEPGCVSARSACEKAVKNDEALVLDQNLPNVPHLQGPDRVTLAARTVEDFGSEVLVLDDGFQHRRLARDLDLVLLDATDPWGLGYLFPRGGLRESPWELRRASAVILTRCNQVEEVKRGRIREAVARVAPQAPIFETTHRPVDLINSDGKTTSMGRLSGRTVAAFCGIGNPEAFRQTLIGLGANLVAWRTWDDHHRYSPSDLDDLEKWAEHQSSECLIVTTQKDLVKIPRTQLGGKELWAIRICFHFESGEKEFQEMLDKALEVKSRRVGRIFEAHRNSIMPRSGMVGLEDSAHPTTSN